MKGSLGASHHAQPVQSQQGAQASGKKHETLCCLIR